MEHVIQYMDTARTETEAREMLAWLETQVDYIGGRVLEPVTRGWWEAESTPQNTEWRVQVLLRDDTDGFCWLPDGCRRVLLMDSQRKQFGAA